MNIHTYTALVFHIKLFDIDSDYQDEKLLEIACEYSQKQIKYDDNTA